MQRKALGRGLEALIPGREEEEEERSIREIPLAAILPNPDQPRRTVLEEKGLAGLVESIRAKGVLQPILVQPRAGGGYELIAGERRWRAARLAGLSSVPAQVREVKGVERLEVALIENIQRQDLNPMEEARAYERLLNEFNLTQEEVSRRVGKERSSVANCLRLLNLPTGIQQEVASGRLSMGHARALLGVESVERQKQLCGRILRDGLSVRQTENIVAHERKNTGQKNRRASGDIHVRALTEQLSRALSTRVEIRGTAERGTVMVSYYSLDDLQSLADILTGTKQPGGR